MDLQSPRFVSEIAKWVIGVVIAVALAAMLIWAFGNRVSVDGHSMTPLLSDGDTVLIDRLGYRFHDIERFDVVSFTYGDGRTSVKRIIGLPGERVRITGGSVYINDSLLDFPYGEAVYNVPGLAEDTVTLLQDEYFVLGDNGDSSEDSRFLAVGTVTSDNIEGGVWIRIAPLSEIGFIGNE